MHTEMFPFWEKVVAPVLQSAEVRRLVEIGALRGEQTQLMIEDLGPHTELHVVDPVPDFDPAEHERRFGGQYVFHRALSVDVLDTLPPMDAALLDGDHNWFTVIEELRLLRQVSRREGAPLPVMVLHDVAWPYGRRDLYYNPDTVPAEHRQPWSRAGMRPERSELLPNGGLNPTMCNADHEGGPRNGVMTGLEDFIAEHDKPMRLVVLPIYFGLAIAVEEERLARQPALAAALDALESPKGKDMLLELAESVRIDAMLFQHRIFFQKEEELERRAALYLDSVKRALVDEHYLETEVRLERLATHIEKGQRVEVESLRDPVRNDVGALHRLQVQRATGAVPDDGPPPPDGFAYAPFGRLALDQLNDQLDAVRGDHVRGDLVACGVGRGGAAILMRAWTEGHGITDRTVWVVDRFRAAADGRDLPDEADGLASLRADLNQVRDGFARFGVFDDRTQFVQGDLDATLPDASIARIAVLHLGRDLTDAELEVALEQLVPRVATGGVVVVDGIDRDRRREIVEANRSRTGATAPAVGLGATGLTWRPDTGPSRPPARAAAASGAARAPGPTSVPADPCDLSVVICFHDMKREAARSLQALSRAYQQGVDDLDYEVVVVENGGPPEGHLGEAFVTAFGPEFRYLDMGDEATPSPADALNRGIRASRGRNLALMVDGAHLVTPGVLAQGMVGLRAYRPAVVATQPWHVGPGQQSDTMRSGYDQGHEDELFRNIEWPTDGYRLFEIGHFHGDRDWLDGLWESNCLFASRRLVAQAGGFEEGFDSPGGGFTNLELFERLGASPDVTVVSILGEGSFHQIHGGTTTNQSDPAERWGRVAAYAERFTQLRGRHFTGPEKPVHYVGSFSVDAARRTRARRMTGEAFAVDPAVEGDDGPLGTAVPVPDEQRDGFINAYFRSHAWRRGTWLGHPTQNAPTDLFTYQELVAEVRPDWIVETGTRDGGRALFLATVCEALGHGRVLSIDPNEVDGRPTHERITYITGHANDDEVKDRVRSLLGDEPNALVILGTRGVRRRTHREFVDYSPLVPVDSYVVVEHTVLNGYPVDASFGPGPFEAVRRILNRQGSFVVDTRREQQALSFNIGGFLRRVR